MQPLANVLPSPSRHFNEATTFTGEYEKRRLGNGNLPPGLNIENLQEGIIRYDNLFGYTDSGLEIIGQTESSPFALNAQRSLRIGATLSAVILNLVSAVGLFYSGAKLISSSLFGGGTIEDAQNSLFKSFTAASLAGLGNAASHENVNWGGGAIGMGIFSKYLLDKDKPWALAAFSIFDALNSKGMGEVIRRDNKNASPFENSMFDSPRLASLRFLMPYEQSIRHFFKRVTTKEGWAKTFVDDPSESFEAASGGLLVAGGGLGIASLFSPLMSERVKSLFYIPYSLTSLLNLIALGRDGITIMKKAQRKDGREPIETRMINLEGCAKAIAAPVLALNYGILGLCGLGLFKGTGEKLAMAIRSWGVAIANIGFAAQSAVKFCIPDLFGPTEVRQKIKFRLYPKIVMARFKELIGWVNAEKQTRVIENRESNLFEPIIKRDRNYELLERISNTVRFQLLKSKSQTGVPNEMALERSFLNRYVHSRRVGALGILYYDQLVDNTTDPLLKEYLENKELETAFKVACLTHDNGQFMRSHLMESAKHRIDNDEESVRGLERGSEIYHEGVRYYSDIGSPEEAEQHAERILAIARDIIGLKHPLSNIYKWADFSEYIRSSGGDFNSFSFTSWTRDDYESFARQRLIYLDKAESDPKKRIKSGFTEEGAITAFKQLYYRLLFNAFINYHPTTQAKEHSYKLGIQNSPDLTIDKLMNMKTESGVDDCAFKGVNNINGSTHSRTRVVFGGRRAYCGYGDPKDRIMVITKDKDGNIQGQEFLTYLERVIKTTKPELYNSLKPMVKTLTSPVWIDLEGEIRPETLEDLIKARAKKGHAQGLAV